MKERTFIGRELPKRTSRFLSLIDTKSTKEREMFGFIVLVVVVVLGIYVDAALGIVGTMALY